MILTKDNILRLIREKKYVTPTTISETFETTTTIGSAALSELAKAKQVAISNLKIGSTPYYYDPLQKSCLIELGEKHLSGYDKEVFMLLKEKQVLNDSSLTIQLKLAIERIKDFALPLEISHQGVSLKFWVWYLRDLGETKKQILEVLNPKNSQQNSSPSQKPQSSSQRSPSSPPQAQNQIRQQVRQEVHEEINTNPFQNNQEIEEESKIELFIENYFRKNYLKLENKHKDEKTISYSLSLTVNKLKIYFDAIYFTKKPSDAEILKFYSSSQKPKIAFIENAPKKLFKLTENLENFELVNI